MPLLKRKPFSLVESPRDLNPEERVFQVRFTKEIFRDYQEYLDRLNLYRQRIWTCKVTGKTNLTYEEALVSEQRATEKVQQFPKELMAPVLHMVQFSTLTLQDLAHTILTRLRDQFLEGVEFYARKDQSQGLCKILEVLKKNAGETCYEVGWLDKNRKVTGTSIVNENELIRKKLPFGREVLKSFIRESTFQSAPWVIHDKLARKYGILTEPPVEFRHKFSVHNGKLVLLKTENVGKKKRKRNDLDVTKESEIPNVKAEKGKRIKYPIDDLLLKPPDDRPSPKRDFNVPMECVGDLLMTWDFCASFSKLLQLWPFSLDDFENALCYKKSNLILIVEVHSAILHLLIQDGGPYFTTLQRKRRKSKITLVTWGEYLCDFLEMRDIPELSSHTGTIKRGHYGLLDTHAKLDIFRELVTEALATDAIRDQLNGFIELRQTVAATKRGEALEETSKKRKVQQHIKPVDNQIKDLPEDDGILPNSLVKAAEQEGNGHVSEKVLQVYVSRRKRVLENGESKSAAIASHGVKHQSTSTKAEGGAIDPSTVDKHKKGFRKRKTKRKEIADQDEQMNEGLERDLEKKLTRTNPLGKDRDYNRYWFFHRDGRIFVENSDSKQWGYYRTKEELDLLMSSLNPKGERERALHKQMDKYYTRMCASLQKRSKNITVKIAMEEAVVRRSARVQTRVKEKPAASFLKYVNKWKENK